MKKTLVVFACALMALALVGCKKKAQPVEYNFGMGVVTSLESSKTGTAQVSSGTDNGIFVGFAPYDDPEIAVVVMVENGHHGFYTAEIVKEVIYEYFGMNVVSVRSRGSMLYSRKRSGLTVPLAITSVSV